MQQGCRGSAPRTHGGPGVLELPELVLEHVFSLLEDTQSKLRCALACSAFARVLGRPSAACWPEARLAVRSIEDAAERARAASFLRWALARAPHLQSIDLDLWSRDHASAEGEAALRPALEALLAAAAPSARIVRLRWGGPALAVDGWVGGASQLTCLALSSYAVSLPSCLGGVTSLRHLELSTVSDAGPGLSPGCLPTSLRKMVSIPSPSGDAGGTALPAAILSLPLLEYLDVSESEFSAEDLEAALPALTRLTSLALDKSVLPDALPPALSGLARLAVLSLDAMSVEDLEARLASMTVLSCLTRLRSLSMSNSGLAELPPALAGMTSLRYLYLEHNLMHTLPPGPYLSGLRALSTDWEVLFTSHGLLASAPHLAQLGLGNQSVSSLWLGAHAGPEDGPPRGTGAEVLASLAAHPALRDLVLVVAPFVLVQPNAEVLEVLLEMRRLRPTLQVRAVESDQFFVAEPQPEDMEEGAAAEGVDA